jgi:protein TonB
LQGINAWRFEPAKYEGKKVKVWAKQKISFDLS